MGDIEFLLLLLLAAAVLVRLADLIAVPYPIVLVVGGLAIGFVPALPVFELDPDIVFLVVLPPLLHAAGWRSSRAARLRRDAARADRGRAPRC